MKTTTEDSYELHKNQLQTDKTYASAWVQKEILVNEAWDTGRSREDRLADLRKSASPAQNLNITLENKRREFVIEEAKKFHTAYADNPQAVLNDLKEKWQAREQGQAIPKAQENASVLDKTQVAEAGLEKTAAAQKGKSHDYSILKNQSAENRPDISTQEGRDNYREKLKAQEREAAREITQRVKTRDDGGRER